jgi:hypothetical protein
MSVRNMPGAWPEDDAECISSSVSTSTAESIISDAEIAKSDLTSESSSRSSVRIEYSRHPWDGSLFRCLQEPRYTVADEYLDRLVLLESQRQATSSTGLRSRFGRCKAALKKATKGKAGEMVSGWQGDLMGV